MQAAVIAVLLGLLLIGMRPTKWNGKYLDKATTSTINGLFIWLVFMSHFTQYLPEGTRNLAGSWLGQLVVVMFLFYSGYGCVVQWQAKGDGYLAEFPKKRMWPTIVNFDIAVAVFVVAGLLIGKTFTVKQMVLSMVCWENVGNSNWYIFAILVCYGTFWLAAGVIGRKVNEICGGGAEMGSYAFGAVGDGGGGAFKGAAELVV